MNLIEIVIGSEKRVKVAYDVFPQFPRALYRVTNHRIVKGVAKHLCLGSGKFCNSLCIIGGGVIGIEMACIYSSLGTKVTIVEALGRLLPMMDRDISQNITMILKKAGVDLTTE